METKKYLGISFGVMAPTIHDQLREKGYKCDPLKTQVFENERKHINHLRFGNNILTDSMAETCFKRLLKAIEYHVSELNI